MKWIKLRKENGVVVHHLDEIGSIAMNNSSFSPTEVV